MTHLKLAKYLGICGETTFKHHIFYKNLKYVSCPECHILGNYFKDDLQARFRYSILDLIEAGILNG